MLLKFGKSVQKVNGNKTLGNIGSLSSDEFNTNSNSDNEIISLMLGWDLFGEKQFLKVTRALTYSYFSLSDL